MIRRLLYRVNLCWLGWHLWFEVADDACTKVDHLWCVNCNKKRPA